MPILIDIGAYNAQKDHRNTFLSGSYYTNCDALDKVIRYITRTRENEDRLNELVCIGGSGFLYNFSVEEIIHIFSDIQENYGITSRQGRRLIHYTYNFTNDDFKLLDNDYTQVDLIARNISSFFFSMGFQIIYAIHHDPEKHRKDFSEWLGIPYRTMQEWELGRRAMPEYVLRLIAYKVLTEKAAGRIGNG